MSTIEEIAAGKGRYVDDIVLPGMLHMAIVRSQYSRGKLLSVNGGYSFKDFPDYMASVGEDATEDQKGLMEPVFADRYVNYMGQPVAAVLGKDRYDAEDQMESVDVQIEPLKPVVDLERALESEPIHPFMKDNILRRNVFGKDFRTDAFEIEVSDRLINRRVANSPIETRGIVASYSSDKLTVWLPTQSVFSIQEGLSEVLKLPKERVHVIQTDTGGAFGLKGGIYPEHIAAARLSMKTGRPVKWIESRYENLSASHPGRGSMADVSLYGDRKGKILGLKGKLLVDSGSYSGGGEFASWFIGMQMTGGYKIDNAYIEALAVLTNKPKMGPYRGAGRPEAHFYIERMVDKFADEIGMDPVDVRLLNVSDNEYTSPTGMYVPPAKTFLTDAVSKLNYRKLLKYRPGFSFFVLVPAFSMGETARVLIKDGKVRVWLGGNSHGQRHELFVKSLINENLGINPDLVSLQMGDTDMMETGVGSWGSRSAMVGGMAVFEACKKIKKDFVSKHGTFATAALLKEGADVFYNYKESGNMNSLGSNLVTCEVNNRGQVNIKECSAYYDVGRALAPEVVRGQVEGGMAQGIGQTLYEELKYSSDGQLLTASLSDAGLPIATQLPEYKLFLADTRSPIAIGAKGVGESPTIGVPPALSRAIENITGKRIAETPIRQETLLEEKESH